MQEFRVEERSYAREIKSLNACQKMIVMQERLFFRNIPLSNWVERKMVVEDGRDLDQLPQPESVFAAAAAVGENRLPISKFLDEVGVGNRHEPAPETGVLMTSRIPAFGAQ